MPQAPDGKPPAPDRDRFAITLRRLRWPVVILWVAAVVLLNPLASGLSNVTSNDTAAYLPAAAQSTRVVTLEQRAQRSDADVDQAVVVFASSQPLTRADVSAVTEARAAVTIAEGCVHKPPWCVRNRLGAPRSFVHAPGSHPGARMKPVRGRRGVSGTWP